MYILWNEGNERRGGEKNKNERNEEKREMKGKKKGGSVGRNEMYRKVIGEESDGLVYGK